MARQQEVADEEVTVVMDGLRRVLSEAGPKVEEMDERGIMQEELFDALEHTGIFRALTPKSWGGLEMTLEQANDALIEGARVSGSIGWVMLIHIQQSLGVGLWPEPTLRRILEENPTMRNRGIAAPKGIAVPTEGGFIVTGQWPFASGGPKPDYVSGNCLVMENGQPRVDADGIPEMLIAIVPIEHAEFLDTWHVLGLRGTNSCDIAIKDVFVPETMTVMNLFTAKNHFGTIPSKLPLRLVLSPSHAAVAVGIALGALDEITELAKTKRAAMNPTALLADDAMFRHFLGENTLRVEAARAMLRQITEHITEAAESLSPKDIMVGRTMTAYVTDECIEAVDWAFAAGGSAPVYDDSPLQRRLRDIHTAKQHISASTEAYRTLGAVLLDAEVSEFELTV